MNVFPDDQILTDSTLSFYSLPFFDPIPVSLISHIKGVACFAHNIAQEGAIGEDGTVELCVVKRRVLQIYKIGEQVQKEKVSARRKTSVFPFG